MPHRGPGQRRNRAGLRPCPRAAGLWRLTAAAGWTRGFLRNERVPSRSPQRRPAAAPVTEWYASPWSSRARTTRAWRRPISPRTPNTPTKQARDAAIQRRLVIAGYDANPVDGIRSSKTDTAIAQFVVDSRLENTAAAALGFFDLLMAAAQKPSNAGFSWCNESRNTVMAAVGFEDQGSVVTRGWYRVAPGKCLRPDLTGKPRRVYSFGEAVGPDNQPLRDSARRRGKPAPLLPCLPRFPGVARPSCARATPSSSRATTRTAAATGSPPPASPPWKCQEPARRRCNSSKGSLAAGAQTVHSSRDEHTAETRATQLQLGRHLDVRPRQHAVSAKECNLWQQIDDRIRPSSRISSAGAKEDAARIQKDYYQRYGTTLRGLMAEHGMEPDEFLDTCTRSTIAGWSRTRSWRRPLRAARPQVHLDQRLHVTRAENVLTRSASNPLFDDIFDIVGSELCPSPARDLRPPSPPQPGLPP